MRECQLHVQNNRITLGSVLRPKDGYELETGVGCTFTLDFETILEVFYSLGMNDDIQTNSSSFSKLQLLHGISKYSNKLSFYCNDCAISAPAEQNYLSALMDKCIFEVNPQKADFPLNGIFHPKVWILLYKQTTDENTDNENADRYIKIIVSSRNLSKSSSLDYAVALEMEVKPRATNETKNRATPLMDWLNYLDQFTPHEKKSVLKTLKKFVAQGEGIDLDNSVYKDYCFLPLGISEEYGKDSIDMLDCEKEWLIVVSPFLGKSFINDLVHTTPNSEWITLLTRRASLDKTIFKYFSDGDVFGLRRGGLQSSSDDASHYRDIHAKMYFYRSNKQNMFLTGSANATNPAFNQNDEQSKQNGEPPKNNVEFMVQFELLPVAVSYESIREELFQVNSKNGELSPDSPFENISPDDLENNDDNEKYIFENRREIGMAISNAAVEQQSDGERYTVVITTNGTINEGVIIAPLNAKDSAVPLTGETRIADLTLAQLSNFYIIERPLDNGKNDSFIKIIETKGIPTKERDSAIDNQVIANKTELYKMIELFLADCPSKVIAQWDSFSSDVSNGSQEVKSKYISKGIYEQILKVAVSNRNRFEELYNHIKSVKDKADDKLVKLFDTINNALKQTHDSNQK